MKIKKLSLLEMYELYGYLQAGLKEVNVDMPFTDFANSLLEELKKTPEAYLRIIHLLSGKSDKQILKMTGADVLLIFLEGLQANAILTFHSFITSLGG
jgi:hypothetical protein